MQRRSFLIAVILFFLIYISGESYCFAAAPGLELEWDHETPHFKDRHFDTASLHVLAETSKKDNTSIYGGLTIVHAHGYMHEKDQTVFSSATGLGPVYMIRKEKQLAGKMYGAFDFSGGIIIWNKVFPTWGRYYDFEWRAGPRLIYKMSEHSSLNLGYMFMHISNGWKTHNPGYNGDGISLGIVTNF